MDRIFHIGTRSSLIPSHSESETAVLTHQILCHRFSNVLFKYLSLYTLSFLDFWKFNFKITTQLVDVLLMMEYFICRYNIKYMKIISLVFLDFSFSKISKK